jgi:hypothetical protein
MPHPAILIQIKAADLHVPARATDFLQIEESLKKRTFRPKSASLRKRKSSD